MSLTSLLHPRVGDPHPGVARGSRRAWMATLSFFLSSCLALAAGSGCDSGSGSGGGAVVATGATGRVAVLMTDAPTDEFVQVFVTVTRIDLLPDEDSDDDRVTIFEGRETFDLLALENVSDPFAIAEDVPVRRYEKLRMQVEEIELVRMNGSGGFESVRPRLVAGGRIDLNPRGGFEVEPGSLLAVRLDMDARRSILINETGNGQFIFRPQVFVEIMSEADPGRLLVIDGIVEDLDLDTSPAELEVCEVAIRLRSDSDRRDRQCLTVFVEEETSIFDEAGLATDLDAIFLGDPVAVFGRFAKDDRERLAIDAELIEIGGSEAFLALTGVISGAFDEPSGTILVDLDPGQGFDLGDDPSIAVVVVEQTRLFSETGQSLDQSDLVRGARVEIDGVFVPSTDLPDVLRAVLLFVEPPPDPEEPDGADDPDLPASP